MTISREFVESKEGNLPEPVNGRSGEKGREGRRKQRTITQGKRKY